VDPAFNILGFERSSDTDEKQASTPGLFVLHRPEDSQVNQVYKIPSDPSLTDIQRVTYFDASYGRISEFYPIDGDDWRGVWRPGGALVRVDPNGNEAFQLWLVLMHVFGSLQ
jgi:hypothetical protein